MRACELSSALNIGTALGLVFFIVRVLCLDYACWRIGKCVCRFFCLMSKDKLVVTAMSEDVGPKIV